MAKNYVQPGDVLDYTATADIASGDVVVVGVRVGVAITDIATGETGAIQVEGVFEVAKAVADAASIGDLIYWDSAAGNATTVSAGNVEMGYVTEAVVNGDALVKVKLNA